MKRRDLVVGLALAGVNPAAGQREQESLYIPRPQLVEDRALLHDFMDEFAFVELVTSSPEIRVTHIPVLLDRNTSKYGTLYGHIARQNPQSENFDSRHPAVVVFRGPDSYISPTWYVKTDVVPTWNFAVVHASGKLRPVTDKKALHDLLAKLIRKFEKSTYDFEKLPDSYTYRLIEHIIGFEMEIERLEGKFKLGQERSEADQQGVLLNLRSARQPRSIHDFTAAFYARAKTAEKTVP